MCGRSPGDPVCSWNLGLLLLLLVGGFAHGVEPVAKEQQLKAAFLYNFTKFVEWPASNFAAADSPIVIGVLGSNLLATELENAVGKRKINGRGIFVKRIQAVADVKGLHLLFVSTAQDARLGELRGALRGANVLTVGESDAFAKSGGVITFVIMDGKVRFDINTTAAERASLKVSAQLQKLARTVRK